MKDEDLELFAAREQLNNNNSKKSKTTRGKYTEIKAHNICSHIADGVTIKGAATAEGITEGTLYRWKKEKPHFAEMINQAVGVSEARLVKKITHSDDWRAALAILERRFPESWAKRDKIDMNVSRSEGIDEVKKMIEQTDHILKIERKSSDESKTSES
tara:strand:+ start:5403 stop:5876 length:474 start_codon:yes stop_codon:yes gene_type:complete